MEQSDFVIVGGAAAGPKTAATLVRRLPDAKVTLFQKGEHISYSACGLPYFASGDVGSFEALTLTQYGVPRDPEFFRTSRGFEVVTHSEVVEIDRNEKTVTVRNEVTGEVRQHAYGKLVLATGAVPVRPPFPVIESARIRPFHVAEDAIAFRRMAEQGEVSRVVIIGGGFVGCELAEAVGGLWGIEPILIEKEEQLLPGMLDREMADLVRRELLDQKVLVVTGGTVNGVGLDAAGKPLVRMHDGQEFGCDYVFLALGTRPEVTLAKQSGLMLGASGGIAVNDAMQTSDPDIYAGGDCVESVHQITGQVMILGMGSLANRHGRVIAENLAGGRVRFPGVLGTRVLRVYDINAGAVGVNECDASRAGLRAEVAWGSFSDKPDYQPESKGIVLKMVYEQGSRRLLGLQAVGRGDICRRLDVFASFLQHRATIDDLLNFEHGYAPPFSEALDPLYHLATIACAQDRDTAFVNPASNFEGHEGEQVLILDVREEEESTAAPLPVGIAGPGVAKAQIPLGQLKCRLAELDPKKRIVIICQRGARSYQAMSILKANSFRSVAVMAGGLLARGDRHSAPGREDG